MAGKPKTSFWMVVVVVVIGLTGYALYNAGILSPKGPGKKTDPISKNDIDNIKNPDQNNPEAPDGSTPTTVKEYTFVAAEKLPPVQGASDYKPMEDNTVKFALNVWAGWAPIVWANGGFKAGKVWKTPGGKKFKGKPATG